MRDEGFMGSSTRMMVIGLVDRVLSDERTVYLIGIFLLFNFEIPS